MSACDPSAGLLITGQIISVIVLLSCTAEPQVQNLLEAAGGEPEEHGTVSRRFECFSCMSLSYQERWEHLKFIYNSPRIFTNRCNEPELSNYIPTVLCSSMCVNLLEPDVEAGVFIGYKFIRGCLERVLRNGFNETAIRTHRFQLTDQCRSLPRVHLYNLGRNQPQAVYGDVQLCTCYGDRCNGSSDASINRPDGPSLLLLFILLIVLFDRSFRINHFVQLCSFLII